MKKLILLLSLFASCTVPEYAEGPISNTGPIFTNGNNSNVSSNIPNLVGQTWRVYLYRVGETSQPQTTSDTLEFITGTSYKFNGNQSTYGLNVTGSGYNLTMYETTWGNLSGSIMNINITSGSILGRPFTDISTGSSNTTKYYLWIEKL